MKDRPLAIIGGLDQMDTSSMANTVDTGLMSVDEREDAIFASYATKSRNSLGRDYPENSHRYRGPFQRDRDRVLHSAAYRRLSGKMQVFTGDQGD